MGSYTLIVLVLKYFFFLNGFVRFEFYPLGFCPMALLSIFAFLCPSTWSHDENVDCPPLYHVIMGSYTLIVGVLKYFLFLMVLSVLSFILLFLLSYGAFVHFCFSLSAHMIGWQECWLSTPVSCDHLIVHLDCWNIKIFSLWGGFVLFEFCPLGLLSYGAFVHFAFLCPPTWSHDENVGCPPLYHVIMGSYTLIVLVLKYFLFLDGFVRFEFYPLGLLSYGAFVHFCFSLSAHVIPWRECWLSTPVSCDHGIVHLDCWSIKIFSLLDGFVRFEFYPLGLLSYGAFVHFCFSLSAHVITWRECWLSTPVSYDHGVVHLDCWNIEIFSLWGGFVRFEFYPLRLLSYGAFVHFAFLCPPMWSLDENVGCPPLYHVIMGSYTLIVLVLKYFLFLNGFVRFEFYPLGFCPMAFLSIFAFLCPSTWSHDENVDCPPLYHVIMGSYTLIVGVLKYFLFLMVLSVLSFILLFLLSYGAFVHFCFSLSAHMIGWQECWLSTPVSCDHLIVHLDCWNIKIFSLFGGFVQCKVWPVYVCSQCIMKVFSIRMWVHYDLNAFFAFLICYGRDLCCWLEKCCKPKVEVENLEILEKSSKHSLVSLPHFTV